MNEWDKWRFDSSKISQRSTYEIPKKEKVWHIEKHPLLFFIIVGRKPAPQVPSAWYFDKVGEHVFRGKKDPNFQIIAFLESSSDCLEMLSCLQEQQGGGLPPRAQASQARGVGSLLSTSKPYVWNERCQASRCKIIPGTLVLWCLMWTIKCEYLPQMDFFVGFKTGEDCSPSPSAPSIWNAGECCWTKIKS